MDFNPNRNTSAITRQNSRQTGRLPGVQALNAKLSALTNRYFGIDLQSLDGMTDEQIGAFADMALDAERWMEIIPILEQHFQKIMQGQMAREQFYAAVQKSATQAGKRIDNSILQTFLTAKGYDAHLQLMSQKAHNGAAKLDADHRSSVALELKDFQSYMQLVAWKHKRQEKIIAGKVAQAQLNASEQEAEAERRAYRKDLLTNGTQAADQNRRRRGFFGGIGDWFNGQR